MTLTVCLAGATGWAGSALAAQIGDAPDLALSAAVSRQHAGQDLGAALGRPSLRCPIFATADEALEIPCDVFVEYTSPSVAKSNILAALKHGAHVVVGTSGLTDQDYIEIHRAALDAKRGVLACGNFAITVVLFQRFAEIAARYIGDWEIIDYAHQHKPDAPSGTARELAHRLGELKQVPEREPNDQPARGALLGPSRVHSVRLPGYVLSTEIIFGQPGQRLSVRHDSGETAEPYVAGALLAIRKVSRLVGLHRGLDTVLDF
jgi:4-hydroxy-tetrahydrodipicolinate reductase